MRKERELSRNGRQQRREGGAVERQQWICSDPSGVEQAINEGGKSWDDQFEAKVTMLGQGRSRKGMDMGGLQGYRSNNKVVKHLRRSSRWRGSIGSGGTEGRAIRREQLSVVCDSLCDQWPTQGWQWVRVGKAIERCRV